MSKMRLEVVRDEKGEGAAAGDVRESKVSQPLLEQAEKEGG